MKKIIMFLTSLILILALAACDNTVNNTEITSEGANAKTSDLLAIERDETNAGTSDISAITTEEADASAPGSPGTTAEEANTSTLDTPAITSEEAEGSTSEFTELLNSDYENALPVPMQLVFGTFKLEDTDLAVDPDQAALLLPLWKAARSLGSSDTAAAEEVGALYKQIRETMTPDQIAAITAMQLRREDMFEVVQELGLSFGGGGGDFTPEMQATAQAARESGQGFPGGPGGGPGGGGPGGGLGGLTPEQRETAIAERGGTRGAASSVNPAFIEAIITLLEGKSG